MNELIDKYFRNTGEFSNLFYPPATDERIGRVEKELGITLPADYKAFLRLTNGFGGFVGESHIVFNPVEEIIEQTAAYCNQFFPWAVHLASTGGGSMYVFDTRPKKLTYGIIPCIADEDDLMHLGTSFEEFVKHLYYGDL